MGEKGAVLKGAKKIEKSKDAGKIEERGGMLKDCGAY